MNLWKECFQVVVLHENMRQQEDRGFADLLNRIREGCQAEDDERLLQTQQVKGAGGTVDESEAPFSNAIRIVP